MRSASPRRIRSTTSRAAGFLAAIVLVAGCAGSDDGAPTVNEDSTETEIPTVAAVDENTAESTVPTTTDTPASPPAANTPDDGVAEPDDTSGDADTETEPAAADLSTFEPTFVPGECPGDPFEETEGVRCGTVDVPLDHADPGGATVTLAVAEISPRGDTPLTTDPVLRLQGGPGGGILDSVGPRADSESRDLFGTVLVDYRGEGRSAPFLDCPEKVGAVITNVTTADPFPTEADRIADAAAICAERMTAAGIDLTHFDTPAIADDLELVRIALGVDRWNLIGVSYGTTTAIEVMRRHPDSVRSAILDSAYPPERTTIDDVAGGLDHALDRLDLACPPGSGCNPTDTPMSAHFADVAARLDAEPITATITDPRTGEPIDALFDGGDFANAAWLAVWTGNVPQLVADTLVSDDPSAPATLLGLVVDTFLADYESFALLQADAVECSDRSDLLSRADIDAAVAARPELAGIFQYATYVGHALTCDAIGVTIDEPSWSDSLVSDIPTLVLAGVWDAVTPPAWGRALLDGLANGRYFEYPGLAHGTWDDTDCSYSITQQFLVDPTAEIDDSCIADMPDPLPIPTDDDASTDVQEDTTDG